MARWTRSRQIEGALVAIIGAVACHRPHDRGGVVEPGTGGTPDTKVCAARHGVWPRTALAAQDPNCPIEYCGLNGSWLGSGVRFRTLHIDGAANPQGLRIKAFHTGGPSPVKLQLDVVGQELLGRTPSGLYQGQALEGAKLILERVPERRGTVAADVP